MHRSPSTMRSPRRWTTENASFGLPNAVILGLGLFLLSATLSPLTTIARAKLWLGPQTLVLGGVGVLTAGLAALAARRVATLAAAAALGRTLRSRLVTLGVIFSCAVLATLIARFAFDAFANSADEYGFLFAARTLLHLRLWNPPPPDPQLFDQNYLVVKQGIWVSQYQPGWPAILALFEAIGLPAWIAAPTCGALLLIVLGAALRQECASPTLAAAALLAYATSDFFLLNAATYFSHCASALMVVGSVWCVLRAAHSSAWYWPVGAGLCVGLAMLCRLDSGALAAIGVAIAWFEQGCRRRSLLLGMAGALPPFAAFAAYNLAITGNPLLPPEIWAGYLRIGPAGLDGVEQQTGRWRMLVQTGWRLGELADTASLLPVGLYIAALVLRWRRRTLRFYDALPVANFVMFLVYPEAGGFQMGPRYWFDGWAVLPITIASTFAFQDVPWRRFATAGLLFLVPISLARLP